MHVSHSSMGQQLLPVPPEQLLPHLRLELDLDRLEVLQPALRSDEGVIRAEEETVLQTCSGFAQQRFGDVFGRPA